MKTQRSLTILAAATSLVACAHQKPQPAAAQPAPAPVAVAAPAPTPALPTPPPAAVEVKAPPPAEIAPVSVYFGFDSTDLTEESRAALRSLFERAQRRPDVELRIEGNCDERGTTEYNIVLGQRRADAARSYLANLGLDPSRIMAVSYGKERPRSAGHDEAAWRENRRDDVVTTEKVASGVSP